MILYEYRPHPRRHGPIRLMTREECGQRMGFMSVCGYTEDVVELIKFQQGTYGLYATPLYLDRAILDFDNADEDYRAALVKCDQEGWSYRSYNTGNRGYHLYIDIKPYCKVKSYDQLELWVSQNFKGYDPCLYKSSSITRIPGTIHHKTGKRMELDVRADGKPADISVAKRVIKMPTKIINTDEEDKFFFAEVFEDMLRKKAYEGGRHAYLFRLAAVGCKAEIEQEYLKEALTRWNHSKCYPALSEVDINKAVRNARRKVDEGYYNNRLA